MEFIIITKNIKSDLTKLVPWGYIKNDTNEKSIYTAYILKDKNECVAYLLVNQNISGSVCLGRELVCSKISHKIHWLEVNEKHRKKGYGKLLVNYVANIFLAKKIPLALYAQENTSDFYYKLGSVPLWLNDRDYDSSDGQFQAFINIDQIDEFFPEGNIETKKFIKNRTKQIICEKIHKDFIDDTQQYQCGYWLKDNQIECENCEWYNKKK